MATKKLTKDELYALVLTTLYATGPISGADLMARTGMTPEEIKPLVAQALEKDGLMGQEGKGPKAKFGLSEEGVAYVEENFDVGQEETEDEGQETAEFVADDSIEYDDEFSQEAVPARRATPPTRAIAGGKGGSKRPSAPASKGATKAAPATAKPAAPARRATVPAKAAAKENGKPDKIVSYRSLDTLDAADLELGIQVGREVAQQFVDAATKDKSGKPLADDPNTIAAVLIMRQVSKYEGRLRRA